MRVVDVHLHAGSGWMPAGQIAARLEAGLVEACWISTLLGGYYPTPAQIRQSNDLVAEIMARLPGGVVGFAYVNPAHGQETALAELRRCLEMGFRGVKLWVATRCDDPRVDPVIQEAVAHNAPILVHCWAKVGGGTPWGGNLPFESTPMDLGRLAGRFPEARLIMAHLGGHWQYGAAVAAQHPNIWVDTSGSIAEMGSIEALVERIGAGRVLFGTDNSDLSYCLGKIMGAGLGQEEREAIFWRNAHNLLQ